MQLNKKTSGYKKAFKKFGVDAMPPRKNTLKKKAIKYVDSLNILNYCFTLTNRIILRNQYHSKDFTIIMFRPKYRE